MRQFINQLFQEMTDKQMIPVQQVLLKRVSKQVREITSNLNYIKQ